MARKEIVENQIQNVEANLGKIKALPDSQETRDMVQGCFHRNSMVTSIKQGLSNRTENIKSNIRAKDERKEQSRRGCEK